MDDHTPDRTGDHGPDQTEGRAARLLAAVDEEPVGSAPVGAIVARGRRDRRRRVAAGIGGVVAAVAAVAVGVSVLPGLGDDTAVPAAGEGTSAGAAESGLPAAPEGTRWVGMADVMVAVPDDATVVAGGCDVASGDAVLLQPSALCDTRPPADAVVISLVQDRTGLDNGEGGKVYIDPTECSESGQTCRTHLTVAGSATSLYLDSADPDAPERLAEDIRLIPDGFAAVPPRTLRSVEGALGGDEGFAAFRTTLESSGFEVDAADVGGASSFTISPDPGTLVEEGSTVTLTPEPGSDPQQPGDARPTAQDLRGAWTLANSTGPTRGNPILMIERDTWRLDDTCGVNEGFVNATGGLRFAPGVSGVNCEGGLVSPLRKVREATPVPGGGYELLAGDGRVLLLMQPAND